MNTYNTRVPPDEKAAPALCLGFQYTLAVESARQVRVNQRQITLICYLFLNFLRFRRRLNNLISLLMI